MLDRKKSFCRKGKQEENTNTVNGPKICSEPETSTCKVSGPACGEGVTEDEAELRGGTKLQLEKSPQKDGFKKRLGKKMNLVYPKEGKSAGSGGTSREDSVKQGANYLRRKVAYNSGRGRGILPKDPPSTPNCSAILFGHKSNKMALRNEWGIVHLPPHTPE